MVIEIFSTAKSKKGPIINEPGYQGSSNFSNARYVAERIVREIRTTPELVGILDTVVTDHFLGEIDFYDPQTNRSLGPTQLKRAKEFWIKNDVTSVFQGLGMDYFMGDAYAWAPSLLSQNKEQVQSMISQYPQLKEMIKEKASEPKKFSYIPSSTTTIKYDLHKVLHYEQNAQGKIVMYSPDEIVHLKLIEYNGELNGLSGLKALAREIAMMYMLKDNILSQLDNGGSPDSIIYLKNASSSSKARFERLKFSLESFSHIKNSHGNLAVDGDVGVHQLGASLKDMEYRELAMFLVSEFLLAVGLPTTRVPFLMTGSGGAANKGNLAGDSEQSYQKKMNNRRRMWELKLNSIFSKIGFSFKFRRDNLQDEVRETQATQMRYSSVSELQRILQSSGKQLRPDVLVEMLSGSKSNITTGDLEDFEMSQQVMGMEQLGSSNKPGENMKPVKNNVQDANSRARIDNATNRGVNV